MAFNTNVGKQQFSATAGQTDFDFNFAIFNDTDLRVYLTPSGNVADDTADILTLSSDYSVSINGTLGGTVELASGASLNDTVTIVRSLPLSRTTDYVTNGDLYADTLDADQDYQTYLAVDQNVRWERSLVLPESYSGEVFTLPAPDPFKMFRWNSTGEYIENIDPTSILDTVNGIIVENVTDLINIDVSVHKTAIVRDINRGGTFIWNSTGTANGGTVFAGTTGYWIRQYSGAVNVKWFGAVGDGVTDDTIVILSAVSYLSGMGGGTIYFPNGTYNISSTINITHSNIRIIGEGSSEFHDAGTNASYPVVLKWTGLINGTMMFIHTVANTANSRINGCSVKNIKFDANNLADTGLHIRTHNGGQFEDLFFYEFLAPALLTDTLVQGTDILEAADNQLNTFSRITFRQLLNPGHCMFLSGNSNSNTSFNVFQGISAQHITTSAFVFDNCDNNIFTQLRAIRPSGSVYSFSIHGTTAAGSVGGSSNIFQDCSYPSTNGCIIRGTTSGYVDGVSNNLFLGLDDGNGSAIPTVEAGSIAIGNTLSGVSFGTSTIKGVFADSKAQAIANRLAAGNETVRIFNGSSNHAILTNGTSSWGINIDGANGDFRIVRLSGSGQFHFTYDTKIDGRIFAGNNIYPTVDNTYSCGIASNRWSVIYAGSGTINTSDDREKTYSDIPDIEMQVAKELKSLVKRFKFNSSIAEKGEENARIHYGTSAQSVIEVFEKYGLNAMDYAMICYDEWDDEWDDEGNLISTAGSRYGIRYEELLCFIMSAM